MKLRTLIIDDEALARERLRGFLADENDIEIIGECGDGAEAIEVLEREQPDLLFLDVQMPELDGFGVLEAARPARPPVVIFTTAFSQHALKAFEVHALDYLLKPFDRDRLRLALDRARERHRQQQSGALNEKLTALLAEMRPTPTVVDRLVVKTSGKVVLIKAADIDWIEAADNYVSLHVGNETHLLRETMNALEGRLNPKLFLRISRSTIVNLERIKELQPMFHGDYTVILRNGTRLNLSRSHRDRLQHLLGK
ncbi:MAG: LytTR family DNA-binding domain-containing protein [Verrucomicrobia bacterium]|nr:LytTR family DNA-binding domain-containing protein [Verrucomicrobiota bacterium]